MDDRKIIRCEPCCGTGIKGRYERRQWKIRDCQSCGGGGQRPESDHQMKRRIKAENKEWTPEEILAREG